MDAYAKGAAVQTLARQYGIAPKTTLGVIDGPASMWSAMSWRNSRRGRRRRHVNTYYRARA